MLDWQAISEIDRELERNRKSRRRREVATDIAQRGFTQRMRLLGVAVWAMTGSNKSAEEILQRVYGRRLPSGSTCIEEWVVATSDETIASVSVHPVSAHHARIYTEACVWVAEWKTKLWLRRQTKLGYPQSGLALVSHFQSALPNGLRCESVLDRTRRFQKGRERLNARYRKWCVRFKRRWRTKRGQLSDKDPLTDEEMIRRVGVPE